MTPEEKAKELVEKYKNIKINGAFIYPSDKFCKQCAIIAVDELIEAFMELSRQESGRVYIDFGHGYWQKVKQHLIEMKL